MRVSVCACACMCVVFGTDTVCLSHSLTQAGGGKTATTITEHIPLTSLLWPPAWTAPLWSLIYSAHTVSSRSHTHHGLSVSRL